MARALGTPGLAKSRATTTGPTPSSPARPTARLPQDPAFRHPARRLLATQNECVPTTRLPHFLRGSDHRRFQRQGNRRGHPCCRSNWRFNTFRRHPLAHFTGRSNAFQAQTGGAAIETSQIVPRNKTLALTDRRIGHRLTAHSARDDGAACSSLGSAGGEFDAYTAAHKVGTHHGDCPGTPSPSDLGRPEHPERSGALRIGRRHNPGHQRRGYSRRPGVRPEHGYRPDTGNGVRSHGFLHALECPRGDVRILGDRGRIPWLFAGRARSFGERRAARGRDPRSGPGDRDRHGRGRGTCTPDREDRRQRGARVKSDHQHAAAELSQLPEP